MTTNRRLFFSTIVAAVIGSAIIPSPLLAEAEKGKFCDGTMEFVVQFGPGASIDIATRAIAASMAKRLDQKVVVVNKAGADGLIAARYVHDAAPDFCTVGSFSPAALTMLPVQIEEQGGVLPYKTPEGFEPIGQWGNTYFVLAVNKQIQVRTMKELVAYAEKHPFELRVGESYPFARVFLQLLRLKYGIRITSIPYKNGDVTSLPNLKQNEIQAAILTVGAALQHIQIGDLHALVLLADTEHPSLLGIPTDVEIGIKELEGVRTWLGMLGPAGLSAEKVKKFKDALEKTLREPEIVAMLKKLGMEPKPSSPDELEALMEKQRKAWKGLAKRGVTWYEKPAK